MQPGVREQRKCVKCESRTTVVIAATISLPGDFLLTASRIQQFVYPGNPDFLSSHSRRDSVKLKRNFKTFIRTGCTFVHRLGSLCTIRGQQDHVTQWREISYSLFFSTPVALTIKSCNRFLNQPYFLSPYFKQKFVFQ